MKSKLDPTPVYSERLAIVLPPDLKVRVFQMAAQQRLPASQLIREAIHLYTTEHAA